jgi:hypothetical protein
VKRLNQTTSQRAMSVREDPLFTWIFVLDWIEMVCVS